MDLRDLGGILEWAAILLLVLAVIYVALCIPSINNQKETLCEAHNMKYIKTDTEACIDKDNVLHEVYFECKGIIPKCEITFLKRK